MKNVLILGATSTIAKETIHELAARKMNLILTGRRMEELETLKSDLEIRYGVNVRTKFFDALNFDQHGQFFSDVVNETNGLDGVLLMYGAMNDQQAAQASFASSREMIDVNYTSAVSILNIAANYFEGQKQGFIGAVSSVAGDRGRQSNYLYGSTKAGLSVYLEGLRARMHRAGVQVLTIKPGTVDTKMTYATADDSLLTASPEAVGRDIAKAVVKKRNVIYTPWFWVAIMLIIKLIPEFIFKRTDL